MAKLGVVKDFLKFKHDMQFGVIGCGRSNISYLPNKNGEIGSLCMVGFAEDVIIWNIQTQEIVQRIHGRDQDNVTFVTYFSDKLNELTISIGYSSGFVSVYSLWEFKQILSIKCHKHPITTIIYCEPYGDRIICGSKDTDISVIDIQAEKGFRLKGHTKEITHLQYVYERDLLISSSQEGSIKLWLLGQNHCFKTIFNNSDIWDFVFINATNLLITASSDPMLRMWQLEFMDMTNETLDLNQGAVDQMSNAVQATFLGSTDRSSSKRVIQMILDDTQTYMAINTGEKKVEIFKVMTKEEVTKRLKKRSKKALKLGEDSTNVTVTCDDRLKKSCDIMLPDKSKSMSMLFNSKKSTIELLSSMKNNTLAVMELNIETHQMSVTDHVTRPGHRTAVIYVQMTSDGQGLLTVSLSEAKLWNKSDLKCRTTIDWPRRRLLQGDDHDDEDLQAQMAVAPGQKLEANTAVLLPGDRHVFVGFKNGVMILYGLVERDIIQWMAGHEESITSLVLTPDNTRILSSSLDKTVRVWKIDYGVMNRGAKGRLQLTDTNQSHQYSHGVSCINVTPDSRTLLVALLNNKVQSCLVDNLGKRVLDFYQHKQPVTCIAVNHDGTEILTGSGDKSVIRWSMQFADCKLFRGHLAEVTDVKYVPGRAEALSCDQSGLIFRIDVRTMTEIGRLQRHCSHVSSLSVRASVTEEDGDAEIVSGSTDGSLRLWFESEEILSREIEAEERRDRQYEEEDLAREELVVVGAPQVTDTGLLTRKTMKTEECADMIIEALTNLDSETVDPRMTACGYTDRELFCLSVLSKCRGGDLELALAQLPMVYVERLFMLAAECLRLGREVHLMVRCLWFLEKIHFTTIKENERIKPLFADIAVRSEALLRCNYKGAIGFTGAALDYLCDSLGKEYIEQIEQRSKAKPRKKKTH